MQRRSETANGEREFNKAKRAGLGEETCKAAREFGEREALFKGERRIKMFTPLLWTFRKVDIAKRLLLAKINKPEQVTDGSSSTTE